MFLMYITFPSQKCVQRNGKQNNLFLKKKSNRFLCLMVGIILILVIICFLFHTTNFLDGEYQMVSDEETAMFYPWIKLGDSGFEFYYDSYSSMIYTGTYKIEQKQLILECNNDPTRIFVFTIDGENLIFDKEQSADCNQEMKSGVNAVLKDGAVFERSE